MQVRIWEIIRSSYSSSGWYCSRGRPHRTRQYGWYLSSTPRLDWSPPRACSRHLERVRHSSHEHRHHAPHDVRVRSSPSGGGVVWSLMLWVLSYPRDPLVAYADPQQSREHGGWGSLTIRVHRAWHRAASIVRSRYEKVWWRMKE